MGSLLLDRAALVSSGASGHAAHPAGLPRHTMLRLPKCGTMPRLPPCGHPSSFSMPNRSSLPIVSRFVFALSAALAAAVAAAPLPVAPVREVTDVLHGVTVK